MVLWGDYGGTHESKSSTLGLLLAAKLEAVNRNQIRVTSRKFD
jgi:hypothetical protein